MFTSKSMSPRLARKSESVACAIARWKMTWLLESPQSGTSALKPGACEWMSVMSGNATVSSAPFHALYRAVPSRIAATAHAGSGMPSTVQAGTEAAWRRVAAVAAVMPRNVRRESFIGCSFPDGSSLSSSRCKLYQTDAVPSTPIAHQCLQFAVYVDGCCNSVKIQREPCDVPG